MNKQKCVEYARDINHAIISCLRIGETDKAALLRYDRDKLIRRARTA